ncbi:MULTISPECIES: AI-2E family transporter [unclassified Bilifractor]|uniref:AI-2E family transporter n=1 Tax=unclassified Bilifractor TaxID=2815795 RepID=UPI003F908FE9
MKFNKNILKNRWASNALAISIGVFVYLFFSHLDVVGRGIAAFFGFINPVIIALIIAYVMDPLTKVFEHYVFRRMRRETARRNLAVVCTILIILAGFVFLMVALIPQIVNSIITFFNNVNVYADEIRTLLANLQEKAAGSRFDFSKILNGGQALLDTIVGKIPSNVDSIINTSFSIGRNIMTWVIAVIMSIYFLADKSRLQAGFGKLMHAILSERMFQSSCKFWNHCNTIMIRYIVGELLDALIIGVSNFVFFLIAGLPYNLLISVVVGVTNLAPTFGPIVGGVVGAFILVLNNPWHALWFIIFTIILQTIDGYVIKPKLFGNTLGVSSVWILVCIIVGGRMFGVPGILLAIPFAAISDYVYNNYILVVLENRKSKKRDRERAQAEKNGHEAGRNESAEPASERREEAADERGAEPK